MGIKALEATVEDGQIRLPPIRYPLWDMIEFCSGCGDRLEKRGLKVSSKTRH